MSTPAITVPASRSRQAAADGRVVVKQFSLAQIVVVWAAATVPMGVFAWIVAPALADSFNGAGNVPMAKALILCLSAGLIWQLALVAGLVVLEQRSLRWPTLREALWLRSPRSPGTQRVGGKLWLILIPLCALFALEALLPAFGVPENRDFGSFLDSDAGQSFLDGNLGWFALILAFFVLNTALGEELLFRGFLLPRMNSVFGRGDWAANGVLFAAYHVHVPWIIPATLLVDTFALSYPTKRYQSAWIGIAVHSVQSIFLTAIVLARVL